MRYTVVSGCSPSFGCLCWPWFCTIRCSDLFPRCSKDAHSGFMWLNFYTLYVLPLIAVVVTTYAYNAFSFATSIILHLRLIWQHITISFIFICSLSTATLPQHECHNRVWSCLNILLYHELGKHMYARCCVVYMNVTVSNWINEMSHSAYCK
jgi:hypothetical protein